MEKGPHEYCDLVMKGGITSGVIYPAAAYELSQKYRFKNIGGTSAGAIAAAVVAAAELGRRTGGANRARAAGLKVTGFDVVKQLSTEVAKDGKLLKLFTPDKRTSKVFRVALSTLSRRSVAGKIIAAIAGVLTSSLLLSLVLFLLGLFLPSLLFSVVKWHSVLKCVVLIEHHCWVCGTTGTLIGFFFALTGALILGAMKTIKSLASNSFGMCSGMAKLNSKEASLTEWIDQQIQAAAGKGLSDPPITFSDLWDAPLYEGEEAVTEKVINLEVVTTGLTQGRPYTVPFKEGTGSLYFDPDELSKLFPARVVEALVAASKAALAGQANLPKANQPRNPRRPVVSPNEKPLFKLPEAADLPILLATRMSLSFPGLLSAIPLYSVDYSLQRNQDGKTKDTTRVGTKVWFSDGGICSNFPINFFDTPIPRWPTFGINLQNASVYKCAPGTQRPAKNFVRLPKPNEPARVVWNYLGDPIWTSQGLDEQRKELDCVLRFASSILNTMQNWRDNLQAAAPGYRDRIVSVQLCKDEGGLNLIMPDSLIKDLTERGQLSGQLLTGFDFSQHTFTRFRVSLCAINEYLESLDHVYRNPLPQDAQGWSYIEGIQDAPDYEWGNNQLRSDAAEALKDVNKLLDIWAANSAKNMKFCRGVPKPKGVMQIRPDF